MAENKEGLELVETLKEVLSKHASCPNECAQKTKQWSTVLDAITEELAASGTFELLFGALATNRERVLVCLGHSAIQAAIDAYLETFKKKKTCSCGLKDAEKAASIRVKGNEYFARGECLAAFAIYTTALMFAPEGDVPLVYSNRAAAYYHLEQYENALEDVERALKLGYGRQKPIGKLLTRKAECLLQIGRISEAKQLLTDEESKIDASERKRWDEVKKQISSGSVPMRKQAVNLAKFRDLSTVAEALGVEEIYPFRPHKKYPWLSSKVNLRYDAKKGRHFLVATEDMDYAEVIALEKPFAALALDEVGHLRCHHCLSACYKSCTMLRRDEVAAEVQGLQSGPARIFAPVPCTTCSSVLFCSEQCRAEAWQSYHRFECPQMTLLQNGADQQTHLALRMLYAAGNLEKVKAIVSRLEQQSSQNPPSKIDPSQYSSIYRVMQAPAEDNKVQLRQAITACLLVKLAHASGYLKDSAHDELFACCLLQRHISQLTANRYFLVHMKHFDLLERMPGNADSFQLASAVAPLMSTSCSGNVLLRPFSQTNLMQSNVQIYAASRYISAGTELDIDLRSYSKDASFQLKPCPCPACTSRDRFPIKCTTCNSMMVHSGAKDGHYRCSSTACNRKMPAETAKRRMASVEELFSRVKPLADYFDDLDPCHLSQTPQHYYNMVHNFSVTVKEIEQYTGAQFLLDLYQALFIAFMKLATSNIRKGGPLLAYYLGSFAEYHAKVMQLHEHMAGGEGKNSIQSGRVLEKLITGCESLCKIFDHRLPGDSHVGQMLNIAYQAVYEKVAVIFGLITFDLSVSSDQFQSFLEMPSAL